jgi:hypothetical protein
VADNGDEEEGDYDMPECVETVLEVLLQALSGRVKPLHKGLTSFVERGNIHSRISHSLYVPFSGNQRSLNCTSHIRCLIGSWSACMA